MGFNRQFAPVSLLHNLDVVKRIAFFFVAICRLAGAIHYLSVAQRGAMSRKIVFPMVMPE
jgi:hypothetical protein